mgnify:CR=1 FL=1
MANIIGPDVSFYQDDPQTPQGIDFAQMRASTNFVIIRAGQNLWVDSDFKANWREAKIAGLARGSYWFYDSRADPKKQADLWVQQFGSDFGELPLFADLEERYNGRFKGWKNWYTFLERVKVLVPQKEIFIYTAYYYWLEFAPNPTTQAANLEYFHKYPLWIANYGAAEPLVPKPWAKNEWLFWQYTSKGNGKPYGVESLNIDLNYFNGDFAAFLTRFGITEQPPPPPPPSPNPPPPPPPPPIVWQRVTTSILKVREGPGLTNLSIGYVFFGEIVQEIGANSDRTWINIRKLDGSLSGWVSAAYLINFNGQTPPVPDVPPTPIPNYDDKNWYRVNTSTLNVRDTPSASTGKIIGWVLMNDTLPALDDSTDPNWVQIERLDGLKGWCSKSYLVFLSTPRPSSIRQNLFSGVTYLRNDLKVPRPIVLHLMVIDLQTANLEFLVTPSSNSNGVICTRTTSKFLDEFKLNFAVNADGFTYLDATTFPPAAYCSKGGDVVKTAGFAASRGTVYSSQTTIQPEIYISARNQILVDSPPGKVFNAFAGERMVVKKGAMVENLAAALANPRTALGLNQNGRWLSLFVIDGRQDGYSEGVTFPEMANLMISYGIYTGVNLDGGGSSTMIIKGVDGKARILNSPIDLGVPGRQRAVANHLGLYIKK